MQTRKPRDGKCPDCGAEVERSEVLETVEGVAVLVLWPCRHVWSVSLQNLDYLA